MLTNYHTHSTYCDGKNTLEEMVDAAITQGFNALGFSGHGYTPFDTRYCMKDTEGYIAAVNQLKNRYAQQLQIYLGVEEDAFAPVKRNCFDYIIGSSHYAFKDGCYYPIDSGHAYFQKCLEVFNHNPLALAESYYENFIAYIRRRKPGIIGHFDLITKFDELDTSLFLNDPAYQNLAQKYADLAADAQCLFEVNTGAIARGYRSSPYPSENLLYFLKKRGAKLVLSADSHRTDTLQTHFPETRAYLRDIGFSCVYALYNGEFVPDIL